MTPCFNCLLNRSGLRCITRAFLNGSWDVIGFSTRKWSCQRPVIGSWPGPVASPISEVGEGNFVPRGGRMGRYVLMGLLRICDDFSMHYLWTIYDPLPVAILAQGCYFGSRGVAPLASSLWAGLKFRVRRQARVHSRPCVGHSRRYTHAGHARRPASPGCSASPWNWRGATGGARLPASGEPDSASSAPSVPSRRPSPSVARRSRTRSRARSPSSATPADPPSSRAHLRPCRAAPNPQASRHRPGRRGGKKVRQPVTRACAHSAARGPGPPPPPHHGLHGAAASARAHPQRFSFRQRVAFRDQPTLSLPLGHHLSRPPPAPGGARQLRCFPPCLVRCSCNAAQALTPLPLFQGASPFSPFLSFWSPGALSHHFQGSRGQLFPYLRGSRRTTQQKKITNQNLLMVLSKVQFNPWWNTKHCIWHVSVTLYESGLMHGTK